MMENQSCLEVTPLSPWSEVSAQSRNQFEWKWHFKRQTWSLNTTRCTLPPQKECSASHFQGDLNLFRSANWRKVQGQKGETEEMKWILILSICPKMNGGMFSRLKMQTWPLQTWRSYTSGESRLKWKARVSRNRYARLSFLVGHGNKNWGT